MSKVYAFFNPLAGKGSCKTDVQLLELLFDEPILYCDLTKPETYEQHLFALLPEDLLVLCGGDGTLSRFFNLVPSATIGCDILYFPLGAENRFAAALGQRFGTFPFSIRGQLEHLPKVDLGQQQLYFFADIRFQLPHRAKVSGFQLDGIFHEKPIRQAIIRPDYPAGKLTATFQKCSRRLYVILGHKKAATFSCRQIRICFPQPTTVFIDGEPVAQVDAFTATIEAR